VNNVTFETEARNYNYEARKSPRFHIPIQSYESCKILPFNIGDNPALAPVHLVNLSEDGISVDCLEFCSPIEYKTVILKLDAGSKGKLEVVCDIAHTCLINEISGIRLGLKFPTFMMDEFDHCLIYQLIRENQFINSRS